MIKIKKPRTKNDLLLKSDCLAQIHVGSYSGGSAEVCGTSEPHSLSPTQCGHLGSVVEGCMKEM